MSQRGVDEVIRFDSIARIVPNYFIEFRVMHGDFIFPVA
jgi:hypothetical protein